MEFTLKMNLYPSMPPVIRRKRSLFTSLFYTLSLLFIFGTAIFILYTNSRAAKSAIKTEFNDINGKIISKFTLGEEISPKRYLVIQQPNNMITMLTVETEIYNNLQLNSPVIYSYSSSNGSLKLKKIRQNDSN
ncbi:MAG: hypothetical protein JXK07_03080 [Spirochaetes bacterium]|nr:hypothetical protein [Spirochaetota bacterium]